ncbi:hypothetical protein G4X40_19725 [Rhodococcus sp. D2-41]|uniref:hypothetical protein n=1 Tax=Speluncibacter jeojiensis TaxID=2710754 RepID=UPI00240FE89C|nr:hypothetical protein [Rhodococcus sp. D2-41]MDG3012373.1 hypothetical protein [Rhodococcus sp. D2-41]
MAHPDRGHGPKSVQLIELLRYFPTEVESDLSHYHPQIDILDWYRGKVSARQVLVRLKHLPDRSELKKAMRDGDWSQDEHVMAAIFNDLRMLRADYGSVHSDGRSPAPTLLRSPAAMKEELAQEQFHTDLHDAMVAQATGKYQPPKRNSSYVTTDSLGMGGDVHA